MNIEQMARDYGLTEPFLNKLKLSNQYISDSANQDKNMINSQLNQQISDYERERQTQNQNFNNEAQSAFVDYAKSINPYSTQRSNAQSIGLGGSGYNESSMIGANNTYQNRYTNTKKYYDDEFANINSKIDAARRAGDENLMKIAKQEQDRLLENLWRLNDEYQLEKQAEEDKRRWEAEMSLAKSKASSGSSGNNYGSLSDTSNGSIPKGYTTVDYPDNELSWYGASKNLTKNGFNQLISKNGSVYAYNSSTGESVDVTGAYQNAVSAGKMGAS